MSWELLGAFMGLSMLSWTDLDPRNLTKYVVFLKVFADAGFRYFEALDGPPGPILAPLGPL